jgi:cytoskeletal protein RodZ
MSDWNDALDALREEQTEGDGVATRHRILDSLERAGQRRRLILSFAVVLGVAFSGTTSWAWFSGVLPAHVRAMPLPPVDEVAGPPVAAVRKVTPERRTETEAETEAETETETETETEAKVAHADPKDRRAPKVAPTRVRPPAPVAPAPVAPAPVLSPPAPTPAPTPTPAPDPELSAYRRAHRTHFDSPNPTAALAAWDAYLSSYPHGRLAPEARWNRAVLLVKLGRSREARAALTPFAEGTESGYRQLEALRLLGTLPPASP